jgi:hypothetical protein
MTNDFVRIYRAAEKPPKGHIPEEAFYRKYIIAAYFHHLLQKAYFKAGVFR